jgi:hypothetical protein
MSRVPARGGSAVLTVPRPSCSQTQTLTILPGPRHSPPYKVFNLTPRPSMACGPKVLLSPATILFISNITAVFPSPESSWVKYVRSGTPQISNNSQIFIFSYKNKLQNNTSRTTLIMLILLPFFACSTFRPSNLFAVKLFKMACLLPPFLLC